ncbi:flagellar hook-basal body complex protein FliE [Deferribacterales bacterium Es71-Z0220]|uniref:flagellar hook-basal body complex protein FliE n=1 Tax=Deferrivibrio essentukiensis TaxID=2880922 RepID=UPI001F620EC2|nr:flagellar hook-basal body complex protein FliE [Deferrivibrio essentukiensis]MCB4203750.1 flagellar hook-basal body complex protein FliE [Deferrivibrio essentukiensis]
MAEINRIDFLLPNKLDTEKKSESKGSESNVNFGDLLKDALKDVNDAQLNADEAIKKVLNGETQNIHETMIALQKADVSLKLMMEVRNKLLEAYQEIMRTQV